MTEHGRRYRSTTEDSPSFIALSTRSNWSYTSGTRTSVSAARLAAIVSGLPLNVPAMSYSFSITGRKSSRVAPIAPHGVPPPIAFARQMTSGITPKRSVAPP